MSSKTNKPRQVVGRDGHLYANAAYLAQRLGVSREVLSNWLYDAHNKDESIRHMGLTGNLRTYHHVDDVLRAWEADKGAPKDGDLDRLFGADPLVQSALKEFSAAQERGEAKVDALTEEDLLLVADALAVMAEHAVAKAKAAQHDDVITAGSLWARANHAMALRKRIIDLANVAGGKGGEA